MSDAAASAIIIVSAIIGGIVAGLLFSGTPDIADAIRCNILKDAGIQCVIVNTPEQQTKFYNNHAKKYGRLI